MEKVFYFEWNRMRTIMLENVFWFVAKDICEILKIDDIRRAIERLEDDEWILTPVIDSLGRKQKSYVVNESGLYSLILRSRKQEAKKFRRWVTHEVLPSIRKTGGYQIQAEDLGREDYKRALREALRENEELERQLGKYEKAFASVEKILNVERKMIGTPHKDRVVRLLKNGSVHESFGYGWGTR